jgi:hypothetical protein
LIYQIFGRITLVYINPTTWFFHQSVHDSSLIIHIIQVNEI